MTWNANLGHGHPRMTPRAGGGGRARPARLPDVGLPRQGARRRAAGGGRAARAGQELHLPVGRGGQRERREDGAPGDRAEEGRRAHAQLPRRDAGHAVAVGRSAPRAFEPGLPGVVRMVDPYCFRCPVGREPPTCSHECADDLEMVLRARGPRHRGGGDPGGGGGRQRRLRAAAPVTGKKIRAICDRHGVLLIADEVLSGFGRTGRWFAVDHDGVTPDLLTMAKGLTGGYAPGGAVIVTDRIARHFDDHVLRCGLTAYAHPLTCAAIVAAIETMRDEGLVEQRRRAGRVAGAAAGRAGARAPVRGRGARRGAAVGAGAGACPGSPRAACRGVRMARLAAALRARHVHMHRRDNLRLLRPAAGDRARRDRRRRWCGAGRGARRRRLTA